MKNSELIKMLLDDLVKNGEREVKLSVESIRDKDIKINGILCDSVEVVIDGKL